MNINQEWASKSQGSSFPWKQDFGPDVCDHTREMARAHIQETLIAVFAMPMAEGSNITQERWKSTPLAVQGSVVAQNQEELGANEHARAAASFSHRSV